MKNLLLTVLLCFVSLMCFSQVELPTYNSGAVKVTKTNKLLKLNKLDIHKKRRQFRVHTGFNLMSHNIDGDKKAQLGFNVNGVFTGIIKKLPRLSYTCEIGVLITDTYVSDDKSNLSPNGSQFKKVVGPYFNTNFLLDFLLIDVKEGILIGKYSTSVGIYSAVNVYDINTGVIYSIEKTVPIKNKSLVISLRQINADRIDYINGQYNITQLLIGLEF